MGSLGRVGAKASADLLRTASWKLKFMAAMPGREHRSQAFTSYKLRWGLNATAAANTFSAAERFISGFLASHPAWPAAFDQLGSRSLH